MKNKGLKIFLICLAVYVTLIVIELCCICVWQRENTWNYIKEFLDWYWTLF